MWGARELVVDRNGYRPIDGVTVGAAAHEVAAVVGGDGAGKTSLLRVLMGLDRPSKGSVTVPPRDRLGVMVAGGGIPADLTVAEVLAFAAGVYSGVEPGSVERALERTGLAAAADRLVGQLSGGMRRKLALAAAVLHRPELLILDEPSAGVDPVSRVDLWALLGEELERGGSVITATTEMDEARRASHTVALHAGRAIPLNEFLADTGSRVDVLQQPEDHGASPLCEVRGLVVRYGRFTAVDGVDLTLGPGEVVGLLGGNGAGKTSTIRALLGLVRPAAGTVTLAGGPPSLETRRKVGYVPQTLGLFADLTVAENAAFVGAVFGVDPPALPDDLATFSDRLVVDLPLGTQRRLAFAVALSHDPAVLILDEPSSGVAPRERATLWNVIHAAAARGVGTLVTTHHLEEATFCHRLVVMADGRVVASGTPRELQAQHETLEDAVVALMRA